MFRSTAFYKSTITCGLFLFSSLSGQATLAAQFHLTTEENPPFNYTDEKTGKFVGIGTELIEAMFKRADYTYSVVPVPWLRAYNSALNDEYTCVFMTAQTKERMPLFKWVGPFLNVEWTIYGRADSKQKINALEDLKKLRIGGYMGDAPVVYLQKQGIEFDLVQNDALNPKKLQMGRIDAWVTNNVRGPILAKKAGIPEPKKLFIVKSITHFLACNKKVPDSYIIALNRQLKALKSKGYFDKIIRKYSKADF